MLIPTYCLVKGIVCYNINMEDKRNVEPELLLPSDVARRLGVSVAAVRNYIAQGRLPVVMLSGGHRAIRPADVERFADERRGPA